MEIYQSEKLSYFEGFRNQTFFYFAEQFQHFVTRLLQSLPKKGVIRENLREFETSFQKESVQAEIDNTWNGRCRNLLENVSI